MTVLLWAISQVSPTSRIHHFKVYEGCQLESQISGSVSSFTRRDTSFLMCPGLARIFILWCGFFFFPFSWYLCVVCSKVGYFPCSLSVWCCCFVQFYRWSCVVHGNFLLHWCGGSVCLQFVFSQMCTLYSLDSHNTIQAQILQQWAGGKWE